MVWLGVKTIIILCLQKLFILQNFLKRRGTWRSLSICQYNSEWNIGSYIMDTEKLGHIIIIIYLKSVFPKSKVA